MRSSLCPLECSSGSMYSPGTIAANVPNTINNTVDELIVKSIQVGIVLGFTCSFGRRPRIFCPSLTDDLLFIGKFGSQIFVQVIWVRGTFGLQGSSAVLKS